MTEFTPTPLFGGAITVSLPSDYQDVSDIRQVPDNQEVYLAREGFSSIVVEILERVEKPTDIEALEYHLSDLVEEDAGETKVWGSADARLQKLPDTRALTLLATSPAGEKMRGRKNCPDFVGIFLVLVRLVEQKTDIIVAINVPHVEGEYTKDSVDPGAGKLGSLLEAGAEIREKVLETFEVKDWGLFVQE